MRITFHGAARTVTGSMHLLEVNDQQLLLDCGLYQGRRQESYERNLNFPFDPQSIDAVILSHAHIDHSGNLPNLVKQGFKGQIYATPASAYLSEVMLADSGHIQEADVFFANKYGLARGEEPVAPIYTQRDALQVRHQVQGIPYEQQFSPLNGVSARLVDAGHMLGSASVDLQVEEKGRKMRIWFSGDIGRRKLPILRDPVLPESADILIMESTYGDAIHPDPGLVFGNLREVVKRTIERGGKLIVPAFAVGRTQELVYGLNHMMSAEPALRVPVYVDSPLAVEASQAYMKFPDCYDEETRAFIDEHRHPALNFDQLTYIRSVEESKALDDNKDPMIIIAASGMAENGRILHHLRNNIEDPRSTILIVSWQAPHTLGRRLADREERVKIFGEVYYRRAEVVTIGGLSAHAGQDLLVEYALRVKDSVRQVYLVHGEAGPAQTLTDQLAVQGMRQVKYPDLHESFEF
jgi:metallo-beta-lactamase family protein